MRETEKIRDRQMRLWMAKQRKILKNITDEEERIIYFEKVVLPEMTALEAKEQRKWDKHRAGFNLDMLDRRNDKDNKPLIIPKMLVEACGVIDIEDKIFSKNPANIHEITADRGLAYLLKQCTDRQKKMVTFNFLPITEHFNAEPKRKPIKKKKPEKYRKSKK